MKANGAKRKIFDDGRYDGRMKKQRRIPETVRKLPLERSARFMAILFGCMKERGWKTWSRAFGSMVF